jgi:hypothetical protein
MAEKVYKKGDLVKVDRGGAGKGICFETIKSVSDKPSPNGSYDYITEECSHKTNAYYIRPVRNVDLKWKKIAEEKDIANWEIKDDPIKYEFWKGQRDNVKKVRDFINDFMYPYLVENKNVIPINKMTDYDVVYKKAYNTKNEKIFVIPHKNLNIVVQKSVTHVSLFVTCPYWDIKKNSNDRSGISIYNFSCKYSDDEYTDELKNAAKSIIESYEKQIEKGYIHNHIEPHYKIIDKLQHYTRVLSANTYDFYMSANLPGSEYTRALFDVGIWRYSLFGWE